MLPGCARTVSKTPSPGGDGAARRPRTSGQAGDLFGNTGLTGTQPAVGPSGRPARPEWQGGYGTQASGGFRAAPPEDPNEVTIPHGSIYRDDLR